MRNVFIVIGFFIACQLYAQSDSASVYVAQYKGNKAGAVSYTFDDGYAEHYTLAAPELEKRGFRGTFFINGSKINSDNEHVEDSSRATWPQLREMSERGHEIANHGWAHRNFARFPLEELKEDILKNDSAILVCVGKPSRTFAYPNNNKSQPGRSYVEQGRTATRLEQRSVGSKRTLQDLNDWVDGLIEKGEWGVGMTHGLTYGYDAFRNPQRLWDHWDYVKQHEDKIWVGTFEEVAAYVKERDSIRLVFCRHKHTLEVLPILDLDSTLFNQHLTMVIDGVSEGTIKVKQGKKKLHVTTAGGKCLFDFDPYGGKIKIKMNR